MLQFWAIFSVAVGVRVIWVIITGFHGLYGQDSYAYVDAARRLSQGYPFSTQIVGMPEPWQIAAAPGYPLAISLFLRVFPTLPADFCGQTINIAAGAAMASWTSAITSRWFSAPTSFIAGVIVALSPIAVQTSTVIMTDALASTLATGAIWASLRTLDRNQPTFAALAGFLWGASVCTRLPIGLSIVPIGLIIVFSRTFPTKLIAISAVFATFAMIPEWIYLNQQTTSLISNHMISDWSPLNALKTHFVTPDGQLEYSLPVGAAYLTMVSGHKFVSPAVILLACAGVWYIRQRPGVLAVLLAWIGCFLLFSAGLTVVNPRYVLSIVPALAILGSVGLIGVYQQLRLRATWPEWSVNVAATLVIVTMIWGQARSILPYSQLAAQEKQLAEIVRHIASEDAEIIGFKTAFALEWHLGRAVTELFFFEDKPRETSAKRRIVVWDPTDLARRATTEVLRQKKFWFDINCTIEPLTNIETIVVGEAFCVPVISKTEKYPP